MTGKDRMKQRPFARPRARALMKSLWAGALRVTGVLALARNWVRREGTVVLTFHRVLSDQELTQTGSLPGMIVRSETFDSFLEYAARELEIMDLAHSPQWAPGPRLKIAVTFDDGWCDNASGAFPIAAKHRAPITVFIVPQRTGSVLPFWPERAAAVIGRGPANQSPEHQTYIEQVIERLKVLNATERNQVMERIRHGDTAGSAAIDRTMNWEQIRELRNGGVVFGSHTSTHEILTGIPAEQAEQEITASRKLIEGQLGAACELFSYPNGNHSGEICRQVARAGYKYAFLNQTPGVWTRDCDPYKVPRVNVCEFHLVDARGNFSPLIFDYAVVWSAAKGHLLKRLSSYVNKVRATGQHKYRHDALKAHGGEP